ncbi:hypothetical protein NADE_005611 [Nannochloris sp. 'desiccata']|nr:hypothetical protein KSW81_007527 [Chlorella desiccata (nom. nud.)]KAH7618762.1 hypothetical protein NADE_005611 [Chlorella desiccata (nom. nud.)]
MVAFKLLDKALTQLKTQREFGNFGGMMAFSDPSLTPSCTNLQPKTQSQPGVSAQTPRTPVKARVTWAKSLELLGGQHQPWTVQQPTKPILKPQDYAEVFPSDQVARWSEHGEVLAVPAPVITSAASKSTCIKLLSKKRSREVAFSD